MASLTYLSDPHFQLHNSLKTGAYGIKNQLLIVACYGPEHEKQTSPNLLFHNITRSKQWQIYCKGMQELVPQTHCQGRTEANLVLQMNFMGKLLWQVLIMMVMPISLFFQSWCFIIAPLWMWCCVYRSATALGRSSENSLDPQPSDLR